MISQVLDKNLVERFLATTLSLVTTLTLIGLTTGCSSKSNLLDLLHKYFFISRRGAEAQRRERKEELLQEVY